MALDRFVKPGIERRKSEGFYSSKKSFMLTYLGCRGQWNTVFVNYSCITLRKQNLEYGGLQI